MSSYEISTIAGLATAAVALTRNGTISVPLNGVNAVIRFQSDTAPDLEAANNVLVCVRNLANSADFGRYADTAALGSYIINVTTSTIGLPSAGVQAFGQALINLNLNDISREYLTPDGRWENFTIQHIVNHEFMHAVTGLDDTPEFINIVNYVNRQTSAGSPRFSYEDVRCFVAGTPILMGDGSHKAIELIEVGDEVAAFKPHPNQEFSLLVSRRVTRVFRNYSKQIINLRGLRCTPGHLFLTTAESGEFIFSTIAAILKADGCIVRHDGSIIRARTGCPAGSKSDTPINISYQHQSLNSAQSWMSNITVRGGIKIPINLECGDTSNTFETTLYEYLNHLGITILENGRIMTSCKKIYSSCDWPANVSLFDSICRINWIVACDKKPFIPAWMDALSDEDEGMSYRSAMVTH